MHLDTQDKLPTNGFLTNLAVVGMLAVFVVPDIARCAQIASGSEETRAVMALNEALTDYRRRGGDLRALTEGKPYTHLVSELRTPIDWYGVRESPLSSRTKLPDRATIAATGKGAAYRVLSLTSGSTK